MAFSHDCNSGHFGLKHSELRSKMGSPKVIETVEKELSQSALLQGALDHSNISVPALLFLGLLLSWRLWRFTITPWLYPNDPKELPYWIPILGHLLPFFNNSGALLTHARRTLRNNREPFAVTVGGSTIYVLTMPKDVADAYRNTTSLSFDIFVQVMMRNLGSSAQSVRAMFSPMPVEKDGFPNPLGKPLGRLARELHTTQLYPGDNLTKLDDKFIESFGDQLIFEKMANTSYAARNDKGGVIVPLLKWSSDVFTRAGQVAYFGNLLGVIDPGLTWTFLEFDDLSWQILFQYPRIVSRRMHAARERLTAVIEQYFSVPAEDRGEQAWFTPAMEHEMRTVGISTHDIATMMTTIYWGINTNTRKASFWMLAYLIKDPQLLQQIRHETEPAFKAGGLSVDYLKDSCPILDGVWNETLRHSAFSASVRHITEDTIIGGKTLRKGNRLMIPYRQLHFDKGVFGEDAHSFDPARFEKNPKLLRSASWRPFGGGITMCPGRYVAKESVAIFIAIALRRFNFEFVEGQVFPHGAEGTPVLGIMSIQDGEDPLVKITPRNA
ncbi:MAG: hypothetical protein Q9221_003750 [Calogaya cf. arnoldii]